MSVSTLNRASGDRLRLLTPPGPDQGGYAESIYRINGYPARVMSWTAKAWSLLSPGERPPYVRVLNGMHVGLVMD